MRGCQTCIHSMPIFVTSDIYIDGYSQTCRDCKAGRKDGYEPVYGEEPKKYIIELSENDYMALKEDGVQNHIALADTTIAHSMPYEERPKGEWIDHSSENLLWGHNECPFCHKRSNRDASYCQYCGADMRGKEE